MITAEAPINGIAETFGDASYPMVLTIGGIERFERKHRGIFEVLDGWRADKARPNSMEVRDMVALGLVGGGMKDAEADKLISEQGTRGLMRIDMIAMGLLCAALIPPFDEDEIDKKKATEPQAGDSE